ncbi:MAG TPA: ThiF family adenylyltransferase [Desulfomonilia bacterium]
MHSENSTAISKESGMASYKELFKRNYGVLTDNEQERIRNIRILIIGDSGTGETIALELARCGFEHLTIAGVDSYVLQDVNRQPLCFTDSAGKNKIGVISKALKAINPCMNITAVDRLPDETGIDSLVSKADIIIPAVDDLSYSVLIFRAARRHAKPAVLCMPSGSMGWVCVIDATTPSIEDVFGIPRLGYKGLRAVMHTRAYRCAQYNFITSGDWRVGWYWDYFLGNRQLALICPVSWLAASLAALETLKLASGRWEPVKAPRCWYISKGSVRMGRFSLFIKYHREFGWKLFGNGCGRHFHRQTFWFWRKVFKFLKMRQESLS